MKLTKQETAQFFNLMWSLQAYVNQKLSIIPNVNSIEEYEKLPYKDKLAVRDALYDNIDLIDSFLETQDKMSEEDRDIVKSWKKFKSGDFFIERLLKKYAVFIDQDKVYAVFALYEPFEEVLPNGRLPYYAKTVLLPFKDKIICDGFLQGYSMSFGGGIKTDLKELYLTAKQNGKIIESFTPKKAKKSSTTSALNKDWGPKLDEISKQLKKLRSSSGAPAIQSPAFSVAKASVELAKTAVENPDDLDQLWKTLKKVDRALGKAAKVLNRAEY